MKGLVLLLCLLLSLRLDAAPITLKEVEFLVRQQIPEDEIVQEVATRHLLTPLNKQAEESLKKNGASDALIARLKSAGKTLSAAEMQAEAKRQAENQAHLKNEMLTDEQRLAEQKGKQRAQQGGATAVYDVMKGRLVKLESEAALVEFDANQLLGTTHYAFYYSAGWCGPCQQFTPGLVNAYKKMKAKYPNFEVIFVSNDRSEKDMLDYMIKHKMPWPAVRFKDIENSAGKWAGKSIPWLVGVNPMGIGETSNARLGKFVDPVAILKEIYDSLGGKPVETHVK